VSRSEPGMPDLIICGSTWRGCAEPLAQATVRILRQKKEKDLDK